MLFNTSRWRQRLNTKRWETSLYFTIFCFCTESKINECFFINKYTKWMTKQNNE